MSLPTISGTARLIEDPELRFGASGVAICKVRLAFNSRKLNQQTQQWEDADSFFVNAVMFKQPAENAAEAFQHGQEVVVTGRLKTEKWETKDGEKRSAPSLLIDSIGPAVNNIQTAKVSKLDRTNGGQSNAGFGGQRQAAPAGDPWAAQDDSQPPF